MTRAEELAEKVREALPRRIEWEDGKHTRSAVSVASAPEAEAALSELVALTENFECEGCSDMEANARRFYDEKVAAVADAEALAEALEAIKSNAESWHGPPPDMGHVRALAVIAKTADNALARYRGEK